MKYSATKNKECHVAKYQIEMSFFGSKKYVFCKRGFR